MKKKIIAGTIALALVSGTAGAAVNQFAQKAEVLKNQYAHAYDQFLKWNPDTREFEKSELERMETTTNEYLDKKMEDLKDAKTEEEKANLRAETDFYIQDIKSFIDSLGN